MYRFWPIVFAVLFLLHATTLRCIAEPWHFTIQNDVVVPGNSDRFLTNAFEYKYGAWAIGNLMYTPYGVSNPEIPYGDRPWDGYTYLEYEAVKPIAFGENLSLKSRLGVVGEASGTEDLQQFVHDDLGLGAHPTWAGQNPSEPTVDFVLTKRNVSYLQSIVGDSQLRENYGIRFGTVNDSAFIDQELRKHFDKYFYPYVGLRGEAVLYNTHLDGRLFQDNNYTIDKEWFVATARAGFELYFPSWKDFFIDYHYEYITQEFVGQVGRHSYGSLSFGTKF